ncbi:hypothetical protein EWM64_g1826 [Hericium alpestre]|uniref:Glycoside hydrolase family 16 protein n=1 Tax=Hericium alpestre TaxID=135208 RepID=A0A4Z0A556_9AGAM|nr:hypothetical protein EWM64_g1826 [Hericium alpestre]
MRTGYAISLIFSWSLTASASSHFTLKDNFVGWDFFDSWKWETMDDPTHGRVNYVDLPTAQHANLTYVTDSTFVMRADHTTKVAPQARGRDSIRISSIASYNDAVIVLDMAHMPEGARCDQIVVTQGDTPTSNECDASANSNTGCGVSLSNGASFGGPLNDRGGGVFVTRKTRAHGVQTWFWGQDDPSMPPEIRAGASSIEPGSGWGQPSASFPMDDCEYDSHFNAHQMVFDLTFCGDWAGSAFATSGCGPGTCEDLVNDHPEEFKGAYWTINAVRVYTPDPASNTLLGFLALT